MKNEHYNALIDAWNARATSMRWQSTSKTYQHAMMEFFLGAHELDIISGGQGIALALTFLISAGRTPKKREV